MAAMPDTMKSVTGAAVTSLTTAAFDITASGNRAAILGLTVDSGSSTTFTGSVGGVSGALITGTNGSTPTGGYQGMLFGVIAPPSGSQTATMSWTGAANAVLGVVTAWGVNQSTAFNGGTKATGTTGTASVAVTSTVGSLTMDNVVNDVSVASPTQIQRWNASAASSIFAGGSTGLGAGTTTHQWTVNANARGWLSSGANFVGDGAPPPGGSPIDDRFRFRPSVFSGGGTSTLGTARSEWPDDARDFGRRDAVSDSQPRMV